MKAGTGSTSVTLPDETRDYLINAEDQKLRRALIINDNQFGVWFPPTTRYEHVAALADTPGFVETLNNDKIDNSCHSAAR